MKIAVLTGAGISAESGLATFRGAGGLWEGYRFEDVASPQALAENPELVHRFYDMRRKAAREAEPNAAHQALAALEREHEVTIVTQNVDDLHERAGSRNVLHLHGELMKARPLKGGEAIPWRDDLPPGLGYRPHVVFFGEEVPSMGDATLVVMEADLLLVVGTSLQVYPAAGLVGVALRRGKRVVLVDPNPPPEPPQRVWVIAEPATTGVARFIAEELA